MNAVQDVRFAIRTLSKAPVYAALAIVTIALGIGASSAAYSLVHGVLLRGLPYGNGERLVHIMQPNDRRPDAGMSVLEVADYKSQVKSIDAGAEYHSMTFQLYGEGDPQQVQTGIVSDNFFQMLGVQPILGRLFTPGEEAVGAAPVVLLSYEYWRDQMASDPRVVGKSFTMNDRIHTVVGVLPPLPVYPNANAIWMPAGACPFRSSPGTMSNRRGRLLTMFARLAPTASLADASRDLKVVNQRLHASYPDAYPSAAKMGIAVTSLHDELTSSSRTLFLMLLGAAVFVLLIAGANFANLMLARQLRRHRELSLRTALGATRRRLFRQLATESLCVTVTGGLFGILIAVGSMGALRTFAARVSPRAAEIGIHVPVLLFALGAAVLVGLAAAVTPMLRDETSLIDALRASGATANAGARDGRARDILVGVQVAVAFVLLIGAGLLVRSLIKLQGVDGGYDTSNVLTAQVPLNWSRYTTVASRQDFATRLVERLANAPGVQSLALASDFPLNNGQPTQRPFQIEGQTAVPGQTGPQSDVTLIDENYLKTIGVAMVRGRGFTTADRDTAVYPALISRRLASAYWPGQDPIGARISVDNGRHWPTIVGVVADVRQNNLSNDVSDEIYLPIVAVGSGNLRVLAKTMGDPAPLIPQIRAAVKALDEHQPVVAIQTLEQLRGTRLAEPRVIALLMTSFAVVALAITAAGLGGVIGYSVTQRTNEIGIRVALGAEPANVLWMILRQGLGIVVAGLVIGLFVALSSTRVLSGLLYGVQATDVVTFACVGFLLVGIAILACLAPALRATRVDPVQALRTR